MIVSLLNCERRNGVVAKLSRLLWRRRRTILLCFVFGVIGKDFLYIRRANQVVVGVGRTDLEFDPIRQQLQQQEQEEITNQYHFHHYQEETCWMVIYHNFKRMPEETSLFLQTYEMFNNQNLYQKLLFIWDSSQDGDSIDYILPHIPSHMSHHFLFLDLEKETPSLKQDMSGVRYKRAKCFGRGRDYCLMLFYKTQLDLFVQAAVTKYEFSEVPRIVAIADADIYWHTLPVPGNVLDRQGRLIFQTINCTGRVNRIYGPAVESLLQTQHYINGGVSLPIPIWLDSFANMRSKLIQLHYQKNKVEREWFDIYSRVKGPLCEFCLMATYLSIYEPERYRFPLNPCSPGVELTTTNVFRDDSDNDSSGNGNDNNNNNNAPSIFLTVHDKVVSQRSRDTILKGCCLTYGIPKSEYNGNCIFTVDDFTELAEFDPWGHTNGYTSPTLLSDHHQYVWHTLKTTRSPIDNERGEEACRRYVSALVRNTASGHWIVGQPVPSLIQSKSRARPTLQHVGRTPWYRFLSFLSLYLERLTSGLLNQSKI
jgi:hypothetical protein